MLECIRKKLQIASNKIWISRTNGNLPSWRAHPRITSTFNIKTSPKPSAKCKICYSNGRNRVPKGVAIAHKQFIGVMLGSLFTAKGCSACQKSRHVSYLPLNYLLEQIFPELVSIHGASSGGPETVMDNTTAAWPRFTPQFSEFSRAFVHGATKVPKICEYGHFFEESDR